MPASSIISFGRADVGLGAGSDSEHITGTKTSGPRGIESVLEYNGLFMNVRSWVDTYIVDNISGIDDAEVRESREVNPDDHGETAFDAFYGGRTIVLSGYIETKTIWKMRDMQTALRQAFNKVSEEKPLIFRTNSITSDTMIMCRKTAKIEMAETQTTLNLFRRAFQITLRASNPRFLGLQEKVSSVRWGYKETFDGQAVTRIRNEVLAPRGAAGFTTGVTPIVPYLTVSSQTAPTPLAGSGTSIRATGTIPANQTNPSYPGLSSLVQVPGGSQANATSFSVYCRFLKTAGGGSHITARNAILRWSNNDGSIFTDTSLTISPAPDVSSAYTTGIPYEASVVSKVPLLSDSSVPTLVQIMVFEQAAAGNASAVTYTMHMTDIIMAFNTTEQVSPFDGESKGAFWLGSRYQSASVKYVSFVNEAWNPEMDANHPSGATTWARVSSSSRTVGYDGKGGYTIGGSAGINFNSLKAGLTLRQNETYSVRWSVTPTVSGTYKMGFRSTDSAVAVVPASISPAPSTYYPATGTAYLEAGKTYTFYFENFVYTGTDPLDSMFMIQKRNAGDTALIGFDGNEDFTYTNVTILKYKIPAGLLASGYQIPNETGISDEWVHSSQGRGSVYSLNGELRVGGPAGPAFVTHKNDQIPTSNRVLTARVRVDNSNGVSGTVSVLARKSRAGDGVGVIFNPVTATTANISLAKINNNTNTTYVTGSNFTISNGMVLFIQVFLTDNVLYAFAYDANTSTLLSSLTQALPVADQTAYGAGVMGDDGLILNGIGSIVQDFTAEPSSIPTAIYHKVSNDGDFDAQPKIRVYGTATTTVAGAQAVVINNETNQSNIILRAKPGTTTCIADNRYIEIDIAKKTVKEYDATTDAFVANAMDRLHDGSGWLTFSPGLNQISTNFTRTSGTPRVHFRYRDTRL